METEFESDISELGNRMKTHPFASPSHRAEFRPPTHRDEAEPLREGAALRSRGAQCAHQQSGPASRLPWARQGRQGPFSPHSLFPNAFGRYGQSHLLGDTAVPGATSEMVYPAERCSPVCESAFGCGACNTAGRSTLRCCSLGFWLGRPEDRGRFAWGLRPLPAEASQLRLSGASQTQ